MIVSFTGTQTHDYSGYSKYGVYKSLPVPQKFTIAIDFNRIVCGKELLDFARVQKNQIERDLAWCKYISVRDKVPLPEQLFKFLVNTNDLSTAEKETLADIGNLDLSAIKKARAYYAETEPKLKS